MLSIRALHEKAASQHFHNFHISWCLCKKGFVSVIRIFRQIVKQNELIIVRHGNQKWTWIWIRIWIHNPLEKNGANFGYQYFVYISEARRKLATLMNICACYFDDNKKRKQISLWHLEITICSMAQRFMWSIEIVFEKLLITSYRWRAEANEWVFEWKKKIEFHFYTPATRYFNQCKRSNINFVIFKIWYISCLHAVDMEGPKPFHFKLKNRLCLLRNESAKSQFGSITKPKNVQCLCIYPFYILDFDLIVWDERYRHRQESNAMASPAPCALANV